MSSSHDAEAGRRLAAEMLGGSTANQPSLEELLEQGAISITEYRQRISSSGGAAADGGFTLFPLAENASLAQSVDDDVHDAAAPGAPPCLFASRQQAERRAHARGLLVSPRIGDAVLFYSQLPAGPLDERTKHGACPVVSGSKLAANVWVWNRKVIYASGQ